MQPRIAQSLHRTLSFRAQMRKSQIAFKLPAANCLAVTRSISFVAPFGTGARSREAQVSISLSAVAVSATQTVDSVFSRHSVAGAPGSAKSCGRTAISKPVRESLASVWTSPARAFSTTTVPSFKKPTTFSVPRSSGSSREAFPSEETEHLSFQARVNSPQFRLNLSLLVFGLVFMCGTIILTKRVDRLCTGIDEFGVRTETRIDELGVRFETRIDELGVRFETRIDELGVRFETKIDSICAKLDARMDKLDAQMAESDAKLDVWLAESDARCSAMIAESDARFAAMMDECAMHDARMDQQLLQLDNILKKPGQPVKAKQSRKA